MKKAVWFTPLATLCIAFSPLIVNALDTTPANADATGEARAVLRYLGGLSSGDFGGVVVGQNCGHGTEILTRYGDYVEALENRSGKTVSLVGVDYEYEEEFSAGDLRRTNGPLIEHWRRGGLVTINMTPTCPFASNGNVYNRSGNDLARLTSAGNQYHTKWMAKLDRIAEGLAQLRDSGVVVLWRPMQEHNGDHNNNPFWYSKKYNGESEWRTLYRHMFDYFTDDKGLNNLLWVYSPLGGGDNWGYPGDDCVDIVAGTAYTAELTVPGYSQALGYNKPVGMAEYGHAINNAWGSFDMTRYARKVRDSYPRLAYIVSWHSWNDANQMAIIDNDNVWSYMNHDAVITLDEMDWGKDGAGTAPSITTQPRNATIYAGATVDLTIEAEGSLPLSYRWQRNEGSGWQSITGATDPAYTTDALSVSDNEIRFRCVVSNEYGNATSNEVIIRVNSPDAYAVPGRIEAEDYNPGGEGVGYHDATPGNAGQAYREDDVDIEQTEDETGSYNVGYIQEGEWLAYAIDVAADGEYDILARVASEASSSMSIKILIDGTTKALITSSATGGWQSWTDAVARNVSLTAGTHELTLLFQSSDMNLNYIVIAPAGTLAAAPARRAPAFDRAGAIPASGLKVYDLRGRRLPAAHRRGSAKTPATPSVTVEYHRGKAAVRVQVSGRRGR
jgi:mannan endo-1,4-beta-mannosidase